MIFERILGVKKQHADPLQLKKAAIYRTFMRRESQMGGKLFGEVPKGHVREFFCLDETTWVWHEEWRDASGQWHVLNTRYDVRPTGILKAQNGQPYQTVSVDEAKRLKAAAKAYVAKARQELYASA